jgi:hypothetical protein
VKEILFKSQKQEWKDRDERFIKLLGDKLGKNKLKFYQYGNTFYLSTENDEYLGFIEGKIHDKIFYVKASSKDELFDAYKPKDMNFYSTMFRLILDFLKVKEINSDSDLSKQAMKSYLKINNEVTKGLEVKVKINDEYLEISEENFLKPGAVIAVSNKYPGAIDEYYNKINSMRLVGNELKPGTYMELLENKDDYIDHLVFF